MFICSVYTAGGSLYHVADSSTECVFFAEALYSRKKCVKTFLNVSAQIEEDLEGIGLPSRYEISAKKYKSALCVFAALILQPNSQRDRWERRGRDKGRGDKAIVTSMAMIGRLYRTLFSLVLNAFTTAQCLLTSLYAEVPISKLFRL